MGEIQVREAVDRPGVLRQSRLGRPLHRRRLVPHGDVATIDPEGYVQITDRTKDLIKSGASGSRRSTSRP
jgi:acyl-CoA synthetase (AMP-forming)/AMP-acid ligase II